jgi:hypothetical protein
MENQRETIAGTTDDNLPINRSCGVLMGIVGILGCISVLPFVKKPVRDSLQLSMTGIGMVLSLFTIISKATEQRTTSLELTNKTNGQEN